MWETTWNTCFKKCSVERGKKSGHEETSLKAISVIPARDDVGLDYSGCGTP